MTYSEQLKDPQWQIKRLKIMERDGFKCRDTGDTDKPLNVHHCWYAKGAPWMTPDAFLITLSNDAHQYRQGLEQRAKKELGLIMAKSKCDNGHEEELKSLVESMEKQAASENTFVELVDAMIYSELLIAAHDHRHDLRTWIGGHPYAPLCKLLGVADFEGGESE